ncbi:MAG: DMP19 family protein [Prevotella sp.]|jgi:hypothetical protein
MEVKISDAVLRQAAQGGEAQFIEAIADAINKAIGGELNADNMGLLNADQITLLGYCALRRELLDGGFVELIHNGWGAFIFLNPFAKAMRQWGVQGLATLMNKGHKYYTKFHKEIERDCSDDEFMALYERFSQFDALDDKFVDSEEEFTSQVAHWVDEHLNNFVEVV